MGRVATKQIRAVAVEGGTQSLIIVMRASGTVPRRIQDDMNLSQRSFSAKNNVPGIGIR